MAGPSTGRVLNKNNLTLLTVGGVVNHNESGHVTLKDQLECAFQNFQRCDRIVHLSDHENKLLLF